MLSFAIAALLAIQPIRITAYVERGFTASGERTQRGIAACPPELAFGTAVEIAGIGRVVCEDRYSARLSPRFDVWVPTVDEARALTSRREWGIDGIR